MRFLCAAGAFLAAAALAPALLSAPAGNAAPHVASGVRERVANGERVRVLVSRDAGETGEAPAGVAVVRSLSGGRVRTGWRTSPAR
ncbi:MAG: hypothetical protein KJ062_23620, partial [Thermoanaerobaculia bacterium]|nr:hypothetical protein [Thermoanaerobaculia bacterium]